MWSESCSHGVLHLIRSSVAFPHITLFVSSFFLGIDLEPS